MALGTGSFAAAVLALAAASDAGRDCSTHVAASCGACGSQSHFELALHHNGSIGEGLKIKELHSHQNNLQLVVQIIQETVLPLLLGVHLLRGVPRQLSESVKITDHGHAPLLEVAELILHPPNQCSRDVRLLELLGELSLGEYLPFRKTGTHSFPPASSGAGEVVGGIQDLLIVAPNGDSEIVLHGAEPILSIQRLLCVRKHRRIGVLEVSEL